MKSLFCWFIKSSLFGIVGILSVLVAVPAALSAFGIIDVGSNHNELFPHWDIVVAVLTWLPAFFTAKFVANNYEEYFMGYYDWLVSRVSFFETKTGFVIRTFFLSGGVYYIFACLIVIMLYATIKSV